jgi:hypothetical protein
MVRSVFVVGPDKKIKAMLTYPMTTGRNFGEVARILDSVQLTAKHQVATPVNWKRATTSSLPARCRTTKPRNATRRAGARLGPIYATSHNRADTHHKQPGTRAHHAVGRLPRT